MNWSRVAPAGLVATLLLLLFGWGRPSPAAAQPAALADGVLSCRGDAEGLLAQVHLAENAVRHPTDLSGGEKQRVAISRALALEPKAPLLDEPTGALDPELKEEVIRVIEDPGSDGKTMVLVTHEQAPARRLAARVLVLYHGRVVLQGRPDDVLRS